MTRRARAVLTGWGLLLSAMTACSNSASGPATSGAGGGPAETTCSGDRECPVASACIAGRCVPRVGPATYAVEIDPPPDSIAALTEIPAIDVGSVPLVLDLDLAVNLSVAFEPSATGTTTSVPATASAILTLPSQIPGQPALTFSGDLADGPMAMLSIPEGARGRAGTLSLVPLAPADQSSAPATFDISVPTAADARPTFRLPSNAYSLRGTLMDALGSGKGHFFARAFQDHQLVSTRTLTAASDASPNGVGAFILNLPETAASSAVTVELTPEAPGSPDPWFTFDPIPIGGTSTDLGNVQLPSYAALNVFQVSVGSDNVPSLAVPGAVVRAFTELDGDPRGSTRFLRDATTDASGIANLSLIPGDTVTPRMYALSFVPPPGSLWASLCKKDVPVLWHGSNAPPTFLLPVALRARPTLAGVVMSAGGTPVPNVVVTASRPVGASIPCLSGPASASTTTNAMGAFALPVDPEVYQIDYDPPAGSPVPRMTEFHQDLNSSVTRTVRLPAAALVEGDVRVAGDPVPYATIRIFKTSCATTAECTTPPLLRAATQADANGHFRAIVAN